MTSGMLFMAGYLTCYAVAEAAYIFFFQFNLYLELFKTQIRIYYINLFMNFKIIFK